MTPSDAWALLKEAAVRWSQDNVPRLSAALAYYTAFSLAPLLVIVVAVVGLLLGQNEARHQVAQQLQALIGPHGAQAAQSLLQSASKPSHGVLATIIGGVVLLLGASGVFGELQSSLNKIWRTEPKASIGVWGMLKDRFLSFTMVLGTGFLLLVSLLLSTALAALSGYMGRQLPGGQFIAFALDLLVSLAGVALLIAAIFKVLPDAPVRWSDAWPGAILSAVLFAAGKWALGLYLGKSTAASVYGAAGSLAALLIWVYYTAQLLLFGAEFTFVYSQHRGQRAAAAGHADAPGQQR